MVVGVRLNGVVRKSNPIIAKEEKMEECNMERTVVE